MQITITRKTGVLALAAAGALATVGVGWAAVPGSDGTIKSCYATTNGLLLGIPHSKGDTRIVDSGEACRSYEKTLSWNQVGPKGPKGDQGIQGVQGIPGKDGLNGAPGKDGLNGAPGADGQDGAPGTNGNDGAPGAQGPAGPSDAFVKSHDAFTQGYKPLLSDDQEHEMLAVNGLTAGYYTVVAKVQTYNRDRGYFAYCRLRSNNVAELEASGTGLNKDDDEVVLLGSSGFLGNGSKIQVMCETTDDGVEVHKVQIIATKVGALRG